LVNIVLDLVFFHFRLQNYLYYTSSLCVKTFIYEVSVVMPGSWTDSKVENLIH